MKVDFYFDWFPGMDMQYANANTKPATLVVGSSCKRYKFTVEIQDPHSPTEPVQEVQAMEAKP